MIKTLWGFLGFLVFAVSLSAQETVPEGRSSGVLEILKLEKAGVDESVLLTYVRSHKDSWSLSSDDVLTLRNAGVPSEVITEALRSGAPANGDVAGVSSAQFFRLYFGYLFYEGRSYPVQDGLPSSVKNVLTSDPSVRESIRSFTDYNTASHVFSWSGLGLIVGGSVYGIVAASNSSTNTDTNAAIAFSAVGTGILSALIGVLTDDLAYQNLYNGLYQYNQDLVFHPNQGGKF